jgi:hypothetical protein
MLIVISISRLAGMALKCLNGWRDRMLADIP